MPSKCQTARIASKCHNHFCFKMSHRLSSTVRAQLYHAGTDAELDANGKRQPVFPAAHRQLRHAVICEANIHSNALHEWGNCHQASMDYQRNAEDQDTVCHLRQCQHQRHWQGTYAVHHVFSSSCFDFTSGLALTKIHSGCNVTFNGLVHLEYLGDY